MLRIPPVTALALVATVALAAAARPALASRSHYLVHVDIASTEHGKSLNLALPWTRSHGGSPFDFTEGKAGDLSLERLRWAWTALRRSPEGEPVTISRHGETTRLSRVHGFLVIEQAEPRDDHHGRVHVPDYIVESVLRGDGRLTDDDIASLLERRGRVVLVKVDSDEGDVSVWIGRDDDDDDSD